MAQGEDFLDFADAEGGGLGVLPDTPIFTLTRKGGFRVLPGTLDAYRAMHSTFLGGFRALPETPHPRQGGFGAVTRNPPS